MKFTCLRWNYRTLSRRFDEMLKPGFPFEQFHWGRANGWHNFASDGTMTGTADWMWSEKWYYADDN